MNPCEYLESTLQTRILLPMALLAAGCGDPESVNDSLNTTSTLGPTEGGSGGALQPTGAEAGGTVDEATSGAAGAAGDGGTTSAPTTGGAPNAAGTASGGSNEPSRGGNGGEGGTGSEPQVPVWSCEDCPPPPATLQDWINGHDEVLSLHGYDGHVAVYVDDDVDTNVIDWVLPFASRSVEYIKRHYDLDCHYGDDRLHVFLHQGSHGGGTISSYFDAFSGFRNAIDMGSDTWVRSIDNVNIDLMSHELAHIVEGSSNCIHESPGFGVWGDSKWAEIFQYDLYLGLELDDDAEKLYQRFMNGPDPWFPYFYYPMYRDSDGVRVLDGFFKLLARDFPKQPENGGQNLIYSRRANLGELVHFYSGAAGADQTSLAIDAFGDGFLGQQAQAKIDFPDVDY